MTATVTLLERLIAARAKAADPAVEAPSSPETETATAAIPPLKLADPPVTEREVVPPTWRGQPRNGRALASEPRKPSPVEDLAELGSEPMSAKIPSPAPLAVDAKQFAAMLGLSVRTVRAMDAAGKLPRPVRFGHAVRWTLRSIEDWLAAGAPERRAWEAMQEARR